MGKTIHSRWYPEKNIAGFSFVFWKLIEAEGDPAQV
jgi:hypothetical protein